MFKKCWQVLYFGALGAIAYVFIFWWAAFHPVKVWNEAVLEFKAWKAKF